MKTVIEMAKEAGFQVDQGALLRIYLENFAELVRADERERWEDVKNYLIAARDGSMSRNNSETLAGELLEQLARDIIEPASTAPVPVYCRHQWVSTGAMKPGECRCIQCGAWGKVTQASTSPHTPT
jgi:hypothetical protein